MEDFYKFTDEEFIRFMQSYIDYNKINIEISIMPILFAIGSGDPFIYFRINTCNNRTISNSMTYNITNILINDFYPLEYFSYILEMKIGIRLEYDSKEIFYIMKNSITSYCIFSSQFSTGSSIVDKNKLYYPSDLLGNNFNILIDFMNKLAIYLFIHTNHIKETDGIVLIMEPFTITMIDKEEKPRTIRSAGLISAHDNNVYIDNSQFIMFSDNILFSNSTVFGKYDINIAREIVDFINEHYVGRPFDEIYEYYKVCPYNNHHDTTNPMEKLNLRED